MTPNQKAALKSLANGKSCNREYAKALQHLGYVEFKRGEPKLTTAGQEKHDDIIRAELKSGVKASFANHLNK
jgi:Mn-dependent DtxR family transcriptional regulator